MVVRSALKSFATLQYISNALNNIICIRPAKSPKVGLSLREFHTAKVMA